mgnify:FL=1
MRDPKWLEGLTAARALKEQGISVQCNACNQGGRGPMLFSGVQRLLNVSYERMQNLLEEGVLNPACTPKDKRVWLCPRCVVNVQGQMRKGTG